MRVRVWGEGEGEGLGEGEGCNEVDSEELK